MISMNDFTAEPEELIQAEVAAAERVIRSGWYVLGKEVRTFESTWANLCGVAYGVGVANGMEALEIGLQSLNLAASDEVITTPMTAFATVLAVIRAGLTPVLADIDPTTGLLDPDSVKRCISPRTKAILLVHLYGNLYQMDRWLELCKHYQISLLEDCAQSHLASWHGKVSGSFGLWGAYSFYPTKNLGAIGDAGALVTNSENIAKTAQIWRNYGQTERYYHSELGLNSRLDEMQAALLTVRLNWLEQFTQSRRKIANYYLNNITNPKVRLLAKPVAPENHVYHLFVVTTEDPKDLASYLKNNDINTFSHYPIPIHHQKPCFHLLTDPKGLNKAEYHAQHCLSIPCHPQMTYQDTVRVVEIINKY